MPFIEICKLTDVFEGSIVRCISRLDELCRMVRNGARIAVTQTCKSPTMRWSRSA